MGHLPFHRLVFTLALLCAGRIVRAQAASSITVDFTYGFGGHSEAAGDTWYRSENNVHPRAAVTGVLWRHRPFAAILTAEYVGQFGAGDYLTDCPPAPNGSCRKYFPPMRGRGVSVGARGTFDLLAMGIGFGRVGAFAWNAVDSDLAFTISRHTAFVAAVRGAWRRGPDSSQIDFWPVNAGIRIAF